MSWFENPTISAVIGAIAGVILTTIVSLYFFKKTNKIKRIDCGLGNPKSLLDISDKIKDKLKIEYNNKTINDLYLF